MLSPAAGPLRVPPARRRDVLQAGRLLGLEVGDPQPDALPRDLLGEGAACASTRSRSRACSNDQPQEFLEAYTRARAARAHGRRARGARRGRLPRLGRVVVRDRREPRRRRRLVGLVIPEQVPNHVDGEDVPAASGEWLDKHAAGGRVAPLPASRARARTTSARRSPRRARRSPAWAARTVVSRGDVVPRDRAGSCASGARSCPRSSPRRRASRSSSRSARRTRRSRWASSSPARAAASTGGRRPRRWRTARSCRCGSRSASPALLISFNTPLPNVAWKVFPAILCGNACVLKPSEHTPASAHRPSRSCAARPGCRTACSTSCRGSGRRPARRSSSIRDVDLVSFTGSAATGPRVNETRGAAAREGRASSSAARTRSSSATTPTSTAPCAGRSPRRSRTRVSAARPRAGSSSSTRSTTTFRERLRRAEAADYDAGPVISEAGLAASSGVRRRARVAAASGSTGRAAGSRRRCSRASRPTRSCPAPSCSGRSRSSTASATSTRRSRSSTTRRTG